MRYEKPKTVEEALGLLADGPWRILAGGTDFYPAQGSKPLRENILDINGLGELRGISVTGDHIVIGARTNWTDIVRADFPPAFDALKQAAREVGAIQIQNTGTVAGNLCNASPAADGLPPLLAMDAEVELRSASGIRNLPLTEFILGNRRTARRANELLTAIRVPKSGTAGASRFIKLGARRYLVISIAMAAARIEVRDGMIADAAIAVGACSEVAQRLTALEQALRGKAADTPVGRIIAPEYFAGLRPIDDVRGSAVYRSTAVAEIVKRAIAGAIEASITRREPSEAAA